jgi:hypothetical protein
MYTYISKTMPRFVKHWNAEYPQAKEEVIKLIREIKTLNDQHLANKNKQ